MKIIRNKYNEPDCTERAKIIKREAKTNSMGTALSSLGYRPKFPVGNESRKKRRGREAISHFKSLFCFVLFCFVLVFTVIIPGVCSSALKVISSKKCPKWESERVSFFHLHDCKKYQTNTKNRFGLIQ